MNSKKQFGDTSVKACFSVSILKWKFSTLTLNFFRFGITLTLLSFFGLIKIGEMNSQSVWLQGTVTPFLSSSSISTSMACDCSWEKWAWWIWPDGVHRVTICQHLQPSSNFPPHELFPATVVNSAEEGAGIAQWLERRTRDWKVAGSNPCWNGGRILFSRVDFLCWLLFRYPFHPCVTTVARKKSWSFCQKVQVAGYS